MRARQVEAVELKRDAKPETAADLLNDADLILTLGGDGTFLAGARVAAPRDIPLLGVNHGHLGFLTEIEAEAMDGGLSRYFDGSYRIEERTMLHVTLVRNG
ncbi:MAG: NAD(+) kinase, partial [Chloroflexi bacterium]